MLTRYEIEELKRNAYAVITRRNVEWQDVVALCETALELYDRWERAEVGWSDE
jgi:hypothetical protein